MQKSVSLSLESVSNFTTYLALAKYLSMENGTDTDTETELFSCLLMKCVFCTECNKVGPKHSVVTCRFQASVVHAIPRARR